MHSVVFLSFADEPATSLSRERLTVREMSILTPSGGFYKKFSPLSKRKSFTRASVIHLNIYRHVLMVRQHTAWLTVACSRCIQCKQKFQRWSSLFEGSPRQATCCRPGRRLHNRFVECFHFPVEHSAVNYRWDRALRCMAAGRRRVDRSHQLGIRTPVHKTSA